MAVTALFTAVLFFVIYYIVFTTVYNHLNEDLEAEQSEVSKSIVIIDDELIFTNEYEWTEKEHGQIEVNPTFIQLVDTAGNNIRKSINLFDDNLIFHKGIDQKQFFNVSVGGSSVRQVQTPIKSNNGAIRAYLIIAIPLEESALVLSNLKKVLFISFPVVLLLLFSVSRFIAGRIISPVNNIITTANHITRENLNERIPIPPRKDELYTLTDTINNLLDRLQDTILREKQFTADASHELRTPISIIKGTLEVLIRKDRDPELYKEKIKYVISEVDRMALLVDQLLSLARYESGKIEPMMGEVELPRIIENVLRRFQNSIEEKNITIIPEYNNSTTVNADASMSEIIFENLISNSVKYSPDNGKVEIKIYSENKKTILAITNYGDVIPKEQLSNIFDRFYRVDENRSSDIAGNGLGLAIVKRLIDLQNLSITAESDTQTGTTFKVIFSN